MSSRTAASTTSTVAVTGAAHGLGQALAERLLACPRVRRVVAVDDRRGTSTGMLWRVTDVRDPGLAGRLGGVDTVVHLAVDLSVGGDPRNRSSLNVRGTQTVLTAAAAAGVRRVVLCTSAMTYGALVDNPVPLAEDGPLRAAPEGPLLSDLLEMERLAERAPRSHPGLSVTVVRPAVLVGPGVDTVFTRHFESPRLLVIKGSRPRWQFCHLDDLVRALEYAATGEVTGTVTVGCEGWLEQDEVERISGIRGLELPSSLAFGTAERLHRLGLTPAPASELAFVAHPWVVPATRLRAAGWRPTRSNAECLAELVERCRGQHAVVSRRLGRKDALGAAGATVALVGTAALVRRVRRRRLGG